MRVATPAPRTDPPPRVAPRQAAPVIELPTDYRFDAAVQAHGKDPEALRNSIRNRIAAGDSSAMSQYAEFYDQVMAENNDGVPYLTSEEWLEDLKARGPKPAGPAPNTAAAAAPLAKALEAQAPEEQSLYERTEALLPNGDEEAAAFMKGLKASLLGGMMEFGKRAYKGVVTGVQGLADALPMAAQATDVSGRSGLSAFGPMAPAGALAYGVRRIGGEAMGRQMDRSQENFKQFIEPAVQGWMKATASVADAITPGLDPEYSGGVIQNDPVTGELRWPSMKQTIGFAGEMTGSLLPTLAGGATSALRLSSIASKVQKGLIGAEVAGVQIARAQRLGQGVSLLGSLGMGVENAYAAAGQAGFAGTQKAQFALTMGAIETGIEKVGLDGIFRNWGLSPDVSRALGKKLKGEAMTAAAREVAQKGVTEATFDVTQAAATYQRTIGEKILTFGRQWARTGNIEGIEEIASAGGGLGLQTLFNEMADSGEFRTPNLGTERGLKDFGAQLLVSYLGAGAMSGASTLFFKLPRPVQHETLFQTIDSGGEADGGKYRQADKILQTARQLVDLSPDEGGITPEQYADLETSVARMVDTARTLKSFAKGRQASAEVRYQAYRMADNLALDNEFLNPSPQPDGSEAPSRYEQLKSEIEARRVPLPPEQAGFAAAQEEAITNELRALELERARHEDRQATGLKHQTPLGKTFQVQPDYDSDLAAIEQKSYGDYGLEAPTTGPIPGFQPSQTAQAGGQTVAVDEQGTLAQAGPDGIWNAVPDGAEGDVQKVVAADAQRTDFVREQLTGAPATTWPVDPATQEEYRAETERVSGAVQAAVTARVNGQAAELSPDDSARYGDLVEQATQSRKVNLDGALSAALRGVEPTPAEVEAAQLHPEVIEQGIRKAVGAGWRSTSKSLRALAAGPGGESVSVLTRARYQALPLPDQLSVMRAALSTDPLEVRLEAIESILEANQLTVDHERQSAAASRIYQKQSAVAELLEQAGRAIDLAGEPRGKEAGSRRQAELADAARLAAESAGGIAGTVEAMAEARREGFPLDHDPAGTVLADEPASGADAGPLAGPDQSEAALPGLPPVAANDSTPNDPAPEVVPPEEAARFVETGQVSDTVLDTIAARVMAGEAMTPREVEIYTEQGPAIEARLAAAAQQTAPVATAVAETQEEATPAAQEPLPTAEALLEEAQQEPLPEPPKRKGGRKPKAAPATTATEAQPGPAPAQALSEDGNTLVANADGSRFTLTITEPIARDGEVLAAGTYVYTKKRGWAEGELRSDGTWDEKWLDELAAPLAAPAEQDYFDKKIKARSKADSEATQRKIEARRMKEKDRGKEIPGSSLRKGMEVFDARTGDKLGVVLKLDGETVLFDGGGMLLDLPASGVVGYEGAKGEVNNELFKQANDVAGAPVILKTENRYTEPTGAGIPLAVGQWAFASVRGVRRPGTILKIEGNQVTLEIDGLTQVRPDRTVNAYAQQNEALPVLNQQDRLETNEGQPSWWQTRPDAPQVVQLLNRLHRAMPGVEVALVANEDLMRRTIEGITGSPLEGPVPIATVAGGTVLIDGSRVRADSPIHEFGHLFLMWMQKTDPARYRRGVSLANGRPELRDQLHPDYQQLPDALLTDEVLATVIGEAGARQWTQRQTNNPREKLLNWASDLWTSIRKRFGLGPTEPVTLEQFAEAAAKDLLGGKLLTAETGQSIFEEYFATNPDAIAYAEAVADPTLNRLAPAPPVAGPKANPFDFTTPPSVSKLSVFRGMVKDGTLAASFQGRTPIDVATTLQEFYDPMVNDLGTGLAKPKSKNYADAGAWAGLAQHLTAPAGTSDLSQTDPAVQELHKLVMSPSSEGSLASEWQEWEIDNHFTNSAGDRQRFGPEASGITRVTERLRRSPMAAKPFTALMTSDWFTKLSNVETVVRRLGEAGSAIRQILIDGRRAGNRRGAQLANTDNEVYAKAMELLGSGTLHRGVNGARTVTRLSQAAYNNGKLELLDLSVGAWMTLYGQHKSQASVHKGRSSVLFDPDPKKGLRHREGHDRGWTYQESDDTPEIRVTMSQDQLDELGRHFEPGGKWADAFQHLSDHYNSDDRFAVLEEEYAALTGELLERVPFYWPTHVAAADPDAASTLTGTKRLLWSAGIFQERDTEKLGDKLRGADALDVLAATNRTAENLVRNGRTLQDLMAWKNLVQKDASGSVYQDPVVAALIGSPNLTGKDSYIGSYLEALMDTRQRPKATVRSDRDKQLLDFLQSNYTKSIFGFNIMNIQKQIMGYYPALGQGIVDAKYLLGARAQGTVWGIAALSYTGYVVGEKPAAEALMGRHLDEMAAVPEAAAIYERIVGKADAATSGVDLSQAQRGGLFGGVGAVGQGLDRLVEGITNHALAPMQISDGAVFVGFWVASKQQVKDRYGSLAAPGAWAEVARLTEALMYSTGSTGNLNDKTAQQRSLSMYDQMLGMFTGQQQKVSNLVMQNYFDWSEAGFPATGPTARALGGSVVWGLAWGAVANSIFTSLGGLFWKLVQGEELPPLEEIAKNIQWNTGRNLLGTYPGAVPAGLMILSTMMDNEKWTDESVSMLGLDAITKVAKLAYQGIDYATLNLDDEEITDEERDKKFARLLYAAADVGSIVSGLPNRPAKEIVKATPAGQPLLKKPDEGGGGVYQ